MNPNVDLRALTVRRDAVRNLVGRTAGAFMRGAPHRDDLAHGEGESDAGALAHDGAAARELLPVPARDRLVFQQRRAGRRRAVARQHGDGCRLPGAVRADQRQDPTGFDSQRERLDDRAATDAPGSFDQAEAHAVQPRFSRSSRRPARTFAWIALALALAGCGVNPVTGK